MGTTASEISNFITPELRNEFYEGLRMAQNGPTGQLLDLLATTITLTDGDTAKFPFVGDIPQMKRWVDERAYRSFGTNTYQVQLKRPWEDTIAIDRTAINRDMTGQLRKRARELGEAVIKNRLKQVVLAIREGDGATQVGNCYDGTTFFADSHAAKDTAGAATTFDNNRTGALTAANLATWIGVMMSFTSDTGHPLDIFPTHALIGPGLWFDMKTLMESPVNVWKPASTNVQTDFSNVFQGIMTPLWSPYIPASSTDIFLLDLSKPIKPVVLVEKAGGTSFDSLEESSEHAFKYDELLWGARDEVEVGYGPWQLGLYSTGA